jgi:hypothetical protein
MLLIMYIYNICTSPAAAGSSLKAWKMFKPVLLCKGVVAPGCAITFKKQGLTARPSLRLS